MLEVKTCGLMDEATIDVAIEAGATHLGFIHFAKSPRHLEIDAIARLIAHASGQAKTVVVTVNADDDTFDAIAAAKPDMLQLHGHESPERVSEVGTRHSLPIVKAFSIATAADLAKAEGHEADRFLFDAKAPPGADLPGGNGIAFDHTLLDGWTGTPFWLAGGLTPDNAAEAVRKVRPTGIDLSSGLESAPGIKDPDRIRQLFANLAATD